MEDKIIKNFLCESECKEAITNTIIKYKIPIEDYEEILTEVKEWIEYLIED